MKLGARIVAITLIFSIGWQLTANSQSELAFIKKYQVDDSVAEVLDKHADEIISQLNRIYRKGITEHETWNFPWLPGYIVKYNLARIHGMEKMKRCIEKHNLDLLTLPDKRIYHVKGRSTKLHNMNYVVVIKKVETDPNRQPLTPRHVQQLITLMEETGYISMTATNYICTYNGKLAMIDTEGTFDSRKLLSAGYMRMITAYHDILKDYTPDALQYLLTRMAFELSRQRRSEYRHVYREINRHLKKASSNYARFFNEQVQKVIRGRA